MDVLEEFTNYDELYFKKNMQEQILEVGISQQKLKLTEIKLLKANVIDRKTILLDHISLYDKAASGYAHIQSFGEIKNQEQLKENIVRKLGSDHIQKLLEAQRQIKMEQEN